MKKILVFALPLCAALLNLKCSKADRIPVNDDDAKSLPTFTASTYKYGDISLPYREAAINPDAANGAAAMVILLHGGSQRGNDNVKQINTVAAQTLLGHLTSRKIKSVLLVPQCPSDRLWNESAISYKNPMSQVLYNWINSYTASNNIDRTRIYILGYSAGGAGVWRMVSDYPTLFAAAMPAAAKALMAKSSNMKSTPIYAVAGEKDELMELSEIRSWIEELQTTGCEVRFDVLPGLNHLETCDQAFTTDRLTWLFNHSL